VLITIINSRLLPEHHFDKCREGAEFAEPATGHETRELLEAFIKFPIIMIPPDILEVRAEVGVDMVREDHLLEAEFSMRPSDARWLAQVAGPHCLHSHRPLNPHWHLCPREIFQLRTHSESSACPVRYPLLPPAVYYMAFAIRRFFSHR